MTKDADYDDVAALVRAKTDAQIVVVIVIDGKRGSGMNIRVKGKSLSAEEAEAGMYEVFRSVSSKAEQRRLGVEPRSEAKAPVPGTEVKGLPDLNRHLPSDDPAQRLLRVQVADEVEAVLRKYDVGGALMLASKDAAAYRSVFPSWCGLQPDPEHVLRLRMKSKTDEDKENADSTMHYIASIREMCSDYANLYGRLWRMAVDALKAQGATVEHASWEQRRGVGGRPDPEGGKTQ